MENIAESVGECSPQSEGEENTIDDYYSDMES